MDIAKIVLFYLSTGLHKESAKTGRGTMIVRRRPSMRAETRDVGVYGKDCISRDNG